MHQVAVLDDFQNVSQKFGDWAGLRKMLTGGRGSVQPGQT